MNSNIENEVCQFLLEHKYASIATCYNNIPYIAKIRYSSESLKIYFSALKSSNKVENILSNPRVAITVDDNTTDKFIQYYGTAKILDNDKDIANAINSLGRVYKYVKYWVSESDVMFF